MAFTHVKVTMRIASDAGDSVTESFYYAASVIGVLNFTSNPIMVDADNLVQKRRLALAHSWYIKSVRVTPAPSPTETATRGGINWRVISNRGINKTDFSDVPNCVQILTLRTGGGHVRQYDIHGVPDDWTKYDKDAQQSLTPTDAVKAYGDYVTSSGKWYLKVLTTGASNPGNPKISTVTVNAGLITMQTAPGLALVAGTKILISGCKGWKVGQFNGRFVIASYDNVTGVLTTRTKRSIDPNIYYDNNSGNLRSLAGAVVDFAVINAWDDRAVLASTHKSGNPIDGRRGRRSVRR